MEARARILDKARGLIAEGRNATVADIAAAAGISRASFYRAFESRDALLEALELAPEPDARQRILDTALRMVGASGLTALSMDDLALQSEVSRATLYRLFAGKAALFTALVRAYSPLEPVTQVLTEMQGEPVEAVMPELARAVYRTFYVGGENRAGMLRALFFEVSSLAPDTEDAVQNVIGRLVASVAVYLMGEMSAGRLRRTHPLLALQSFVGPIFFHLMTRAPAERLLGFDIAGEQAVTLLAEMWLRAMSTKESET
ncbi:MAG: TetR/AcrR family transcriptional regulator [Chloroflexi bacterium]|nr:MAG: TetR/AcrR family transcriptional regulator [Chloroflexota bacterium]